MIDPPYPDDDEFPAAPSAGREPGPLAVLASPGVIVPLACLLIAAALLIGCKDCEQLQLALVAARASGNAAAIEEVEKQIAKAGCSLPEEPPPTPKPDPTPPPVNCLTHPTCPAGQHCEQGVGCVPDPLPDPEPITCQPGEIPVIVDGEVRRCDPAPAEGCSIDGEPGAIIPGYAHALGAEVNAAMAALRPDCPVGGRCVLTESRLEWQALVIAELRRRGICAGQHAPTTDEIAVAVSSVGVREGWHVYAEGLNVPGTIVWAPHAARPVYAAPSSAPTPPATPPGESCPAEPCPDRSKGVWKLKCKPHGRVKTPSGEWVPATDCTPVTERQEPYCRKIGMSPMADGTLRAGCPMRPDGHPERGLVEAWVAGPTKLEGKDGAVCGRVDGNPLQFYAESGRCQLCSADGLTCGGWF
jgi:hypothetical protein